MSKTDQCPSSVKQGKPAKKPRASTPETVGVRGQKYWRGLEDLADTPVFREALEREFPSGASELLEGSRRTFLKLMGASLALAGVSTLPACRRPDHKILPYSRSVPEEIIPGKPLFYATSMPLPGGGAEGLLIETHEGRPTKVEGNPLHPINQGKSSAWAQAAVLDLYDPDRLTDPVWVRNGQGSAGSWDDFKVWSGKHFAKFDAAKGAGLAFIYDKISSPTHAAVLARVAKKWPQATLVAYDALENAGAIDGLKMAFGSAHSEVLDIAKAKVIVSLDRDFLQHEAGSLANCRGWGASRRALTTKDSMSRLYAIAPGFSPTAAAADHFYSLAPSLIPALAVALAQRVLAGAPQGGKALAEAAAKVALPAGGLDQKFVDAVAADLLDKANLGKSLVVCGPSQPAEVHALCAAMNFALGNTGNTVSYLPQSGDAGERGWPKLAALTKAMGAGSVDTVVVLNANPVFNAPADLGFAAAFAKVPNRITLSLDGNETVAASTWQLPAAHFLESWGDTEAADGTVAPIQPMIAPLFGGKSAIEVLAIVMGEERHEGYDLVRDAWGIKAADIEGDRVWRRALHDGVKAGSTPKAQAPKSVAWSELGAALAKLTIAPAPTEAKLDVAFSVGHLHDGRFANNGWLQELPDPVSRVVWDNPAYVSVKTAEKLGIMQTPPIEKKPQGRVVTLNVGGQSMRVAVWAVPGVAENTVILQTGQGRTSVGLVGRGAGFNVFAARSSGSAWSASGATLQPAEDGERWYKISCTQTHGSMEGRALVREVDLPAWQKHGDEPLDTSRKDAYGRSHPLNFAERLEGGEFNHMPALIGIYDNPMNAGPADAQKSANAYDPAHAGKPASATPYTEGPQWGMSIDLGSCIGCNVCTIACQAENNIPIVGKIEVNKGREMTWIRVDRYFKGQGPHAAEGVVYQPVACVHCENAPCETVCPVNATVHGPEGHNYMTYNRCIGTRYCANNCPYKVRRFNFFDYGVAKYQGGLKEGLEESLGATVTDNLPANHNLIPPRLRKKLDEISKMGKNPNVTVRSRGVMEKCSYCIQRTNEAKIEAKLKTPGWRPEDGLPDGSVQTACQQACPTGAIVFGDILDAKSNNGRGSLVRQMRDHQRSYLLLGYLNTRPRTTYMAGLRNPNPALRAPDMDPFEHHGGHDAPHGSEHAPAAHGKEAAFVDPIKQTDDGYRLSLAVLGARA
jgi:molybdopterin-containing oxidoreductase family iron-sulfur binding subunit